VCAYNTERERGGHCDSGMKKDEENAEQPLEKFTLYCCFDPRVRKIDGNDVTLCENLEICL